MIGKETIQYSLRNLAHRKARSFLTVLSIFIGIATIFIFISFGLGLYFYVDNFLSETSADKVLIIGKGFSVPGLDPTFKLEDKDLRAIERAGGVFEATGAYIKISEVEFNKEKIYAFLTAYEPKKPLVMEVSNMKLAEGRELNSDDKNKVTLGYNYLVKDKIFSRALRINDKIKIQGQEMRVVGFYESIGNPQDDSNVYVINDAIDELYPDQKNFYGMIIARVETRDVERVIENIERNLRNAREQKEGGEDFYVQSFESIIESYMSILNIIVGFIVLIALISVLVSVVNTANTMITSVLERKKEIGVMKAVGARNREIFGIFLFESSFLGFVAGVVGVTLGWTLSGVGGKILEELGWGFLQPAFPIYLFVGCILFATISGAISGAVPAWRASKINTVDALRYE